MKAKLLFGLLIALIFFAKPVEAQPDYDPSYEEMVAAADNLVQFEDVWQVNGLLYPSRDYENVPPLTGTAVRTYSDGRKTATEFKDGRGAGLTILWYANGQKAMQGTLVDNELEGTLYQWDETGKLVGETEYSKGEKVGAEADSQTAPSP